ncbi:hypothetical protein OFC13_28140, partial [Escherichia coli]|nr:hypothetical protein [Escherichia coli]
SAWETCFAVSSSSLVSTCLRSRVGEEKEEEEEEEEEDEERERSSWGSPVAVLCTWRQEAQQSTHTERKEHCH